MLTDQIIARRIKLKGYVQGIGLRPAVYHLAKMNSITGFIRNCSNGVEIHAEGEHKAVSRFSDALRTCNNPFLKIHTFDLAVAECRGYDDFTIKRSSVNQGSTCIHPDISVCSECLNDIVVQDNRKNYWLVNCTHCGPRFSIVKNLPYDRKNTTMQDFSLCDQCKREYTDIFNRRYHAQPVACNECGPRYTLFFENQKITKPLEILNILKKYLASGNIMALKGIGGFQIIGNALDPDAVRKIREIKNRPAKPLAVMFRDEQQLKRYASPVNAASKLLNSWQKPIVIVPSKLNLPHEISPGLHTVGVIFPYMALHYQLLTHISFPLIFTSANISGKPIAKHLDELKGDFHEQFYAVLDHNRPVENRVDDSVFLQTKTGLVPVRKSRGYVPVPLESKYSCSNILGVGAELNSTFAIGMDHSVIQSPYLGDLKQYDILTNYKEYYKKYMHLFQVEPELVVHDFHPGYESTRFASKLGVKAMAVQHHHAHIASCMGDNKLDEPVIGVCFDGTGYGTDGHLWGSEFFVSSLDSFSRKYHFEYFPLPGGEAAIKKPVMTAVSLLKYFCNADVGELHTLLGYAKKNEINLMKQMIQKGINTPLTCGMGRLFDGVTALLGLQMDESQYSGQYPMLLEANYRSVDQGYTFFIDEKRKVVPLKPLISGLIHDIKIGKDPAYISGKFHRTIINITLETVRKIAEMTGLKKVVLSGGCFQNRVLLDEISDGIKKEGLEPFTNTVTAPNDSAISYGQVLVASKKQKLLCV